MDNSIKMLGTETIWCDYKPHRIVRDESMKAVRTNGSDGWKLKVKDLDGNITWIPKAKFQQAYGIYDGHELFFKI